MPLCQEIDYPPITLQSLAGFSEDKAAERSYARRFYHLSLGDFAAALGFCAFVSIPHLLGQDDNVPLVSVCVVLAGISILAAPVLIVRAWRRMVEGIPVSPQSGMAMEVYRQQDTVPEGKYELVYLCRQSRTYFRMVFKAPED